ncbi:hypothetical protein BKA64DRAFT_154870 [Cadophora sp. MPI-SDFR-AT-0126]|nr:hypothetical protein BKA64DRAFT_154870 [Leotiomycetes sp. MPI-SDFR-AT-0126]
MSNPNRRTRRRTRPIIESCFYCFQKGKKCNRSSKTGCCSNCHPRLTDPIVNAVSFVDSEVRHHLDSLVERSDSFSSRGDDVIECTLVFEIQVEHNKKDKSKETRQISRSLHISQPFYPNSEFARRDMDTFVWEHLSLQMRCFDDQSHLVYRASLAGAHLTLMFPLVEEDLSWNPGGDDHAERHVTKFCLLRFAALLEDIVEPLRNLNSPTSSHEEALNIIAAAGVLYCELEYVNQGFQARKLRLLCVSDHLWLSWMTRSSPMC